MKNSQFSKFDAGYRSESSEPIAINLLQLTMTTRRSPAPNLAQSCPRSCSVTNNFYIFFIYIYIVLLADSGQTLIFFAETLSQCQNLVHVHPRLKTRFFHKSFPLFTSLRRLWTARRFFCFNSFSVILLIGTSARVLVD